LVVVSYGQLPDPLVSRITRSITTSRGWRVRKRRASRVRERRDGERLGDGVRGGVLLPEPLPFSFVPASGGQRPRCFGDVMAAR